MASKFRRNELTLLLAIPMLVPLGAWSIGRSQRCRDKVDVSVGTYSDWRAGQRAALRRLSDELRRCPRARYFKIRRTTAWPTWDNWNKIDVTYSRKLHVLDEDHQGTGGTEMWGKVDEENIHAVASASGTFKDLPKFGCKDIRP